MVFTLNVRSQLTLPVLLTAPILLPMQLPLYPRLYSRIDTDVPGPIELYQRLSAYALRPLLLCPLTIVLEAEKDACFIHVQFGILSHSHSGRMD